MNGLTHSDKHHLDAAEGWLMLGLPACSLEEIDQLSPANRSRTAVRKLEWQAHAATGDWMRAWQVAQGMIEQTPTSAFAWIHRAYALRRMPGGGLEQARDALLPSAARFPRNFLIPYNLACYAAQLGRLDEAWEWFERAVALGEEGRVRRMALEDEDLQPLRARIEQLPGG